MADLNVPGLPNGEAQVFNSSTHEITYYLNVENAKKVALCITLGFILYHGIIHVKYGNNSCKWILSDGRFPGYNMWQPYGCMMHKYTKSDARMCMQYISYWGGHNHIAFLGDSRIRQLYYEFVSLMATSEQSEAGKPEKAHSDKVFHDEFINVKVEFLWHPMVNLSMFNVYKSWSQAQSRSRPNFIVTGSATWCIKVFNGSEPAKKSFYANLTTIIPQLNKLKSSTKVLWMLQDPVYEDNLNANRSMITNDQLDDYNKIAISVLSNSPVEIWTSSRLVGQGLQKEFADGLHASKAVLEHDIQMLMNVYCNNHMNYNDGTCCSEPEPATTLQIITAATFLVFTVCAIGMIIYRRKSRRNGIKTRGENGMRNGHSHAQKEKSNSIFEIVTSVSKLGIIMGYFYLCDRTNFFMKENKYYTHVNFFLPLAYVMVLGFFFTESSDHTNVLHRDQTDEWKGWMQLVILIYHLTGASKVLPIYMHIRVFVSSYLFLTGYGHFSYFWNKGDYGMFRLCQHGCRHCPLYWHMRQNGLRRLLEVLFRLNMLVVLLCFVMNRPYQFYYFVPLVSFWFIAVYFTMAIWPQVNLSTAEGNVLHYLYLILKLVLLAVVVTLLYLSEVFFEKVFLMRPLKALFVTSDDSIHEWRFRWQVDRYSVIFGMLFALGYHLLVKHRLVDDTKQTPLFSKGLSVSLLVLSLLGLGSYMAFAFLCRNKPECNDTHAYIVFVPIVSFILLRNIPGSLRTRYSSFFAWFGKISLELFISQYHIWLAADTHGVLVLVPGYPVLNVITTSFIFICVSHEISKLTGKLSKYAIPNDCKSLVRNSICFLLILLPIGISNGRISTALLSGAASPRRLAEDTQQAPSPSHIILTPGQPVAALTPFAERQAKQQQQLPLLESLV